MKYTLVSQIRAWLWSLLLLIAIPSNASSLYTAKLYQNVECSTSIPCWGQFYCSDIDASAGMYYVPENYFFVKIGGGVRIDKIKINKIINWSLTDWQPIFECYADGDTPVLVQTDWDEDVNSPTWDRWDIYAVQVYYQDSLVGLSFFTGASGFKAADGLCYMYNVKENTAYASGYDRYNYNLEIPASVTLNAYGSSKEFEVTGIRNEVFQNSGISSLKLGKNLRSIGPNCFKGCCRLEEIVIEDSSTGLDISPSLSASGTLIPAFSDSPLKRVYLGRNLYSAEFRQQSELNTLEIGNSVTYLPSSAFKDCTSLTDVTMGKSVKSINEDAFNGCRSIEKIDLPAGLTKIGQRAFENCTLLKALILPETIAELGTNSNGPLNPNYIFSGCHALEDMICLYPKSVGKPIVEKNTRIFTPDPQEYGWGEPLFSLLKSGYEYSGKAPVLEFAPRYNGDISRLYNIEYTTGLVNEDACINVGYYDAACKIDVSYNNGSFSYNYRITFKITPAQLTITAQSCSREYGKPNPSIDLTYSGFKNNENESVLTQSPMVTILASEESNVGEYPIEVSGAKANNYEISYIQGILTIEKANQWIEWNQNLDGLFTGEQLQLKAISSSRLPIKYIISDSDIVKIEGETISCLAAGDCVITAVQEGNENFNAAKSIERNISIHSKEVENLYFNSSEVRMKAGESYQLTVSWEPEGFEAPEMVWKSENSDVASVNEYGVVSGIHEGATIITVSLADNSEISASCNVIVDLVSGVKDILDKPASNYVIDNNELIINDEIEEGVKIYDLDGSLIYSGREKKIRLNQGIYILIFDQCVHKIKI